jgi:hypothetical protein
MERCYACDRKLGKSPKLVTCEDEQDVYVGSECYKLIVAGATQGYQPPLGGPRLYLLEYDPKGKR